MKYWFLPIIIFTSCAIVSRASDDNDYWLKIKKLAGRGTPQDNTAVRKYLMSLTKDQTLTALRQYSKTVEAKYSVDEWPQLIPNVALIMAGYCEPPRISAEALAKLSKRARRNYQEGSVPGPLSEEAFNKLSAAIKDKKEQDFFRYALVSWATVDEDISPNLSTSQKKQLFDTCLVVMIDRESPEVVSRACCDAAKEVFRRECWRIIYADDIVKEFMHTGTPEQRRNLDSLLNSGEIKLTAKTVEQLEPWRKRIQDFRKVLVALQADEREPKPLKEQAKKYTIWLDHSPLINAKGNTTKSP